MCAAWSGRAPEHLSEISANFELPRRSELGGRLTRSELADVLREDELRAAASLSTGRGGAAAVGGWTSRGPGTVRRPAVSRPRAP